MHEIEPLNIGHADCLAWKKKSFMALWMLPHANLPFHKHPQVHYL
jgi:hypothetical protein